MIVLTAGEMGAIERAAISRGDVTGRELMERAGRGVVEAVFAWRPALAEAPGSVVVLCGPGNNGGDGFVVARLLRGAGWDVSLFLYGEEARLPPDAAENARLWRQVGDIAPFEVAIAEGLPAADLYIDALFGGGLSRALPESIQTLHRNLDPDVIAKTMAVDAPSGLCLDSGRALGFAFGAAATCTFQRPRRGHYLDEGPGLCGRLFVSDIGLDRAMTEDALSETLDARPIRLVASPHLAAAKPPTGHKYSHGHVLIPAGGPGKGGAARLAGRGALRIGAGLVTLAPPSEAIAENAARLDAIMLAPAATAEAFGALLEDSRITTVVLGPGLGVTQRTEAMVSAALRLRADNERRNVVLDADAMTVFADAPERLFAMVGRANTVMTPHMGEFGRLFPDIRTRLGAPPDAGPAFSKVDAVREAAARAGCVILLKGADTVIAAPDGEVAIAAAQYERRCPWLATAGAGDVLAGMIGGLLARGFPALAAAEAGAWLHQECARRFGPGLIAEDLPEELPGVLRSLAG